MFNPYQLIGMEEVAAKKAISSNNFVWQVIERDGQFVPHFHSIRLDRISLRVEDNTIISAFIS